jgi:exosortase
VKSLIAHIRSLGTRRILLFGQIGILLLLTGFLYGPLALQIARQWWKDPNYTHGFFVPAFSLFLIWERRAKLAAIRIQPAWSGLMILVVALITLAMGTGSSALFLCRISLLLVISGIVVFLAGWRFLAAISFPLAVLVLMIPSATLLDQITFPLQMVASKTATFLLSMSGIPVYREGNIIMLPSARLEVAEACSGVRSLFSLITLTVIYGYLAETNVEIRVLLALVAVPVSVLANALRITVTGLVVEFWGVEGAGGILHLLSGWLVFAASLALIFLFHRLAQSFLAPEPPSGGQEQYA